MILRDKYGWPVETVIGRPIQRIVRLMLHTSLWQTWKRRHGPTPLVPDQRNDTVMAMHKRQYPEVFSVLDSFKPKPPAKGGTP